MQNKQIQRSLNNLEVFFQNPHTPLRELISAFYFSADMLLKQSTQNTENSKQSEVHFLKFNGFMEEFICRDFSALKIHEKQIVDQIVQIVQNPQFLKRLNKAPEEPLRTSYLESLEGSNKKSSGIFASSFWSELSEQPVLQEEQQELNSIQRKCQLKQRLSKSRKAKVVKEQKYEKLKEMEAYWSRLEEAYSEHRIDEAERLRKDIIGRQMKDVPEKTAQIMNKVEYEYLQMMKFFSEFNKPGWTFEKQKNNLSIYSKIDEGDPLAGVMMQGEFDIPIENFLAILSEPDLLCEYVPFCQESRQIKRVNRNELIGKTKISIPFLSNRGMVFYSVGYDRMKENGSIFLYSRTINQKEALEKYNCAAKISEKEVQLDYKYFIVEYKPLSLNTAKIKIASKVDMQMKMLPKFILKTSAIKFGFDYFKNIQKINENFQGSPWEQKMKEHFQLYEFFMDKIAEYILKSEKGDSTTEDMKDVLMKKKK